MTKKERYLVHDFVKFDYSEISEYIDENHTPKPLRNDELVDILNNQLEMMVIYEKEIVAYHDALTTIIELCTAVLNYDFKNVNNKVDFCHMLNEMDNKDLAFLKECFEAIRNRDLKKMTSLIMEIKKAKEIYKNIENNKVM